MIAGAHSLVNDDQRAKQITKLITEMLATDDLPFNFVNNTGFRRLLQHLEPRYHLSDSGFMDGVIYLLDIFDTEFGGGRVLMFT